MSQLSLNFWCGSRVRLAILFCLSIGISSTNDDDRGHDNMDQSVMPGVKMN
jgi:hypothetical protein